MSTDCATLALCAQEAHNFTFRILCKRISILLLLLWQALDRNQAHHPDLFSLSSPIAILQSEGKNVS